MQTVRAVTEHAELTIAVVRDAVAAAKGCAAVTRGAMCSFADGQSVSCRMTTSSACGCAGESARWTSSMDTPFDHHSRPTGEPRASSDGLAEVRRGRSRLALLVGLRPFPLSSVTALHPASLGAATGICHGSQVRGPKCGASTSVLPTPRLPPRFALFEHPPAGTEGCVAPGQPGLRSIHRECAGGVVKPRKETTGGSRRSIRAEGCTEAPRWPGAEVPLGAKAWHVHIGVAQNQDGRHWSPRAATMARPRQRNTVVGCDRLPYGSGVELY